jgi:hypothetical protein
MGCCSFIEDAIKDIGYIIDDEVIQPIIDVTEDAIDWAVDEIVDPVVDMGQDILEAAGEDPLKTIATIAAIATNQIWLIPLIDGAAVLADGGDLEDAAKAAAISYVATTVGATAGTYASGAVSGALGASVSASAASTISTVIGAGTKASATALVYGQDPLKAFITGGANAFVSASLGKISDTMKEKFGSSYDNLNDGVKNSIYAGVSAEVSGGALTPEAMSNVIMKNAAIGGTMKNFLEANAGFTDAQASILTNAVTSAVTKTILGNPDAAGEAFFNSISAAGAEALKTVIDKPVNTAIDKVSGAYKTTEEKALALDEKTKTYNKIINDISVTENAHNELLDELNGKLTKQDELKQKYLDQKAILDDAKNIMSSDNPYSAEFVNNMKDSVNEAADAYNTFKDNLATDYEVSYKPALDAYNKTHADYVAQLPDAKTEFDTASSEYDTSLKYMNTKYEDFDETLKPATTVINKAIALYLSNDFDEDAYKAYYGLEADADVYGHFLEQGQNLPTNASGFATVMDKFHLKTMQHTLAGMGIDYKDLTAVQLEEVMTKIKKEVKNPASVTGLDFESLNSDLESIIQDSDKERPVQGYKKADGVRPEDIVNGNALLDYDNGEFKWTLKSEVGKPITVSGGVDGSKTIAPETINDAFMEKYKDSEYADYYSVTVDESGEVKSYKKEKGDPQGIVITEGISFTSLPDMIKEKQEAGEPIPASYMDTVVNLGEKAGKLLDEYVGTPFYESAKKIYDAYVSEGAKDVIENTASIIGGATGETLKAISGLSVIVGANPNNSLGKFADNLISASGDLRSEEYANALGEIDNAMADYDKQWREDNPGQEPSTAKKVLLKAQAIYGAAWDNPVEFLSEYVVKEIIQEVPLLLVSGGVGNIAKKGLLEAGEAYATKIATKASLGTALTLDATEAFGGTAAGAFDEAYATAIKTGMSEQEATDYAIDIAQAAGTTAVITLAATAGIGGQALAKSVLGDKVDDVSTGAFNALFKKIKEGGTVTVKEGVTESIEEGLPQLITGMSLAMIDPTYDVAGNVTGSAILGKLTGAGTAGGIYTGNAVADTLMSVNSSVINAMGNAGNPTLAVVALGELGITDNVILNNILNTSYDTQYVSTAEAAKAFENQNPDYIPTEAEIESFVSNRPDSEVATLVASYIDKRYLDVDEIKAAAEASGITLTDEQAEKFVGQNPDETEALNAVIEEIENKSLFYTDADGNNVFAGYYPNMGGTEVPVTPRPGPGGPNRPPLIIEDKPSSGEVPDGLTPPPAGSITSPVMVDYVNEITGETYSAPNSGYTPVEGSGWVVKPPASVTLPVEDISYRPPHSGPGSPGYQPTPMPINPNQPPLLDGADDPALIDDPLTADDVKDIIDTAIDNLPESASPEDVSSAIEDALAGMDNLSDADVSSAIEDALADMNNLSSEDVQDIVDEATGVNAEAISDLETSLTALIEENNGDVSAALNELATAMNVGEASILEELGTTEAELLSTFEAGISGVEESVSNLETSLTALIEENNGDVNAALDELANDLGTTEADILEELGTTEAELLSTFEAGISGVEESVSNLETSLTALIEENNGDVNAALDELANDLGTTEADILEELGTTEAELLSTFEAGISGVEESVSNLETSLTALIEENNGDVSAALDELAGNLGTTEANILEELGTTEAELLSTFEAGISGVEESVTNLETSLTALIEENNGDVNAALDELANNLETTEADILEELDTTEAELTDKFEAGISGVEESVSNLETSLTELIEENNGDVTAALDELADNLGTTEANILEELGTTEANLIEKFETGISGVEESIGGLEGDVSELSNNLAALGLDVDTIADLIGKPAYKVTEADVDFVIDLIAQENVSEELTMQYDVTGDGIVDINDQNMLSDKLQGNDVTFADTSMFNPATGLYLQQEQDTDATMDAITDLNTTITTNIDEENKRRKLAEAEDMFNQMTATQQVSVKTPDPMNIDYLYDFNSIFANPSQEGLFGSPYGNSRQAANTPMQPLNRASGFAKGGQVEDENDRLLRLLGDLT